MHAVRKNLRSESTLPEQAAKVAAEGPILTQQAYTTFVNRLMLLLRRAEGNSRISSKLKKRAKVGQHSLDQQDITTSILSADGAEVGVGGEQGRRGNRLRIFFS